MLTRPDEKVRKALHNVKHQQDWAPIQSWIEDSLKELREESDNVSDETLLRWNQGACQTLARLLDYVAKTKSILEQLNPY